MKLKAVNVCFNDSFAEWRWNLNQLCNESGKEDEEQDMFISITNHQSPIDHFIEPLFVFQRE